MKKNVVDMQIADKLLSRLSWLLILSFHFQGMSQVTVSGPTCVIPGTIYQYIINGPWDSASKMQVCISGGLIAANTSACSANGTPQPFVLVRWNSGTTGSLNLSSSKGNNTVTVNISSALNGGIISSQTNYLTIKYDTVPSTINCSPSSGGSCSPNYTYQWQESSNAVSWQDIRGATGQNLSFSSAIVFTTFYRRKAIETGSGTIAYSNIATVDVFAQIPIADSTVKIDSTVTGSTEMRRENSTFNRFLPSRPSFFSQIGCFDPMNKLLARKRGNCIKLLS
jgi:hypothetical protein